MKSSEMIQRKLDRLLDGLLTVQDLTAKHKVSEMTIKHWRQRGMPAIVILGGKKAANIRFVPHEVKAWMLVKEKRGKK